MTPEKDAELCTKYSKIFKNRNMTELETPITQGLECDDGWFDLVSVLCHNIQSHVDWKSSTLSSEELASLQPVIDQVKEKFGGLRFYVTGGDETIEGMIRMAESMSYKLCERCGNKGNLRSGDWIRTSCDSCDVQQRRR